MARQTLARRVEILEQKVERLETLPARVAAVELQILQLRQEMRAEFSAMRQELTALFRTELKGTAESLTEPLTESLTRSLRAEIREGDEETRRYMRVLHEEVIARLAALGDARR
jgi:hypothetical protein